MTGQEEGAGTTAEVSINMVGQYGQTGYRKLAKSLTCSEPFQPGQTDVFHMHAVHLGPLTHVLLKHDGKVPGMQFDQMYTALPQPCLKRKNKLCLAFSFMKFHHTFVIAQYICKCFVKLCFSNIFKINYYVEDHYVESN